MLFFLQTRTATATWVQRSIDSPVQRCSNGRFVLHCLSGASSSSPFPNTLIRIFFTVSDNYSNFILYFSFSAVPMLPPPLSSLSPTYRTPLPRRIRTYPRTCGPPRRTSTTRLRSIASASTTPATLSRGTRCTPETTTWAICPMFSASTVMETLCRGTRPTPETTTWDICLMFSASTAMATRPRWIRSSVPASEHTDWRKQDSEGTGRHPLLILQEVRHF